MAKTTKTAEAIEAELIDLNKKASKLARDIKYNQLNNDSGIWNSEAARKRHDRLTAQLEKLDAKIDALNGE
jgi:hypothetical protein